MGRRVGESEGGRERERQREATNERLGTNEGLVSGKGRNGEERSEKGEMRRTTTKRSGKRKPKVLEFRLESTACQARAMPHLAWRLPLAARTLLHFLIAVLEEVPMILHWRRRAKRMLCLSGPDQTGEAQPPASCALVCRATHPPPLVGT